MKVINLRSENQADFSMQFVDDDSYDVLVEKEDTTIYKPDGSLLAVFRKKAISKEAILSAWSVLQSYNQKSRNRGVAAGRENEYATGNGRSGNTLESPEGWEVASGIVGFFERTARLPYCRPCGWNQNNPEKFKKLLPMCKEVSDLFEQNAPEYYAYQDAFIEKTQPDWVIPGTVFTTLTINKNFRTACHKDAGDLEKGRSNILVIRKGKFGGGVLVFPAFRVGVKLDTHDLLTFDPHEFHGNTQIVSLSKDAERCSVVFYFREKMTGCKCSKAELDRVKNRKTGTKLWD